MARLDLRCVRRWTLALPERPASRCCPFAAGEFRGAPCMLKCRRRKGLSRECAVPLTILLLMAVPAGLNAELYRCAEPDGSVSYQETACTGSAQGDALALPASNPARSDRADPADHWSVQRQLERMQASDVDTKKRPAARAGGGRADSSELPARPRRVTILNAIRRHQVIPGMLPQEVDDAWGPPLSTRTDGSGPRSWSYRGEDADGKRVSMTVRFKHGRVTGVSGSAAQAPSRFDPDSGRWLE